MITSILFFERLSPNNELIQTLFKCFRKKSDFILISKKNPTHVPSIKYGPKIHFLTIDILRNKVSKKVAIDL